MRSFYATSFMLVSGCCANGLLRPSPSTSEPTITPAPQIPAELLLQRQNGNRFMGWMKYEGEWTSRQCDFGGTLYQNGEYWRCCATTVASCNVPVGCVDGSLVYTYSTGSILRETYACTDIYTEAADASFTRCNSGFLYENTLDSNPQTNIFCGIDAVNWSYYREKPLETSTSETTSTTRTSRSSRTSTSTTPSATSPTVAGNGAPTDTPNPEPTKKESNAWIAGAVVGPIAGIAILGAALFLLLRRRRNKTTPAPPGSTVNPSIPPQSYPGSPNTGYQEPYYPPMAEQNGTGFVPYGVGVNENKHQSYYAPSPNSAPHSHASTSPIPPNSPHSSYMLQQQQTWQQYPQPQDAHMVAGDVNHPPQSYSPQYGNAVYPHVAPGPQQYPTELDAGSYQPNVGTQHGLQGQR